ncbi:MAG: DUF507 family protein [Bdellovibrionales bacterium]
MSLSEDRQDYLVHIIVEDFLKNKQVTAPSRDILFQKVKMGMNIFIKEWKELDQEVVEKLKSIKRGVLVGSSEWDVLYRQYLEDGFKKKSSLFVKKY